MTKDIEINELELKKKDKKKEQLDHDCDLWLFMIVLGVLNQDTINDLTSPILTRDAKYVIKNAEDFTSVNGVTSDNKKRLQKSFYKLGMLHNPEQEERVIQLSVINARKYIGKINDIDTLKESESYKKELKSIAKAKSITMLKNDYTRMMTSLSTMEFYRVYEGRQALWKKSTAKKKRVEHLAVAGRKFIIGIGINIPYSPKELAVILPYKYLHPKQLINCQCDVILLDDIEEE